MTSIKSIFSRLGKFLEKARMVLLNLGTALVLIFITIAIVGIFPTSKKRFLLLRNTAFYLRLKIFLLFKDFHAHFEPSQSFICLNS